MILVSFFSNKFLQNPNKNHNIIHWKKPRRRDTNNTSLSYNVSIKNGLFRMAIENKNEYR